MVFIFGGISVAKATACNCGSFEGGVFNYFTVGDADCCDGRQDTTFNPTFTTFIKGPGSTWIVDAIKNVSFSDAKSACCFNS